jgi:hypothetical protein
MAKGRFKKVVVPATTNNITKAIVNFLDSEGHCAVRVNRTGIWDRKGKFFRKSGTTKAVLDIHCTLKPHGRSLWIDTKTGTDTPSLEQLQFAKEVAEANGLAIFIVDYANFLAWYNSFDEMKVSKEEGARHKAFYHGI